MKQYGHLLGGRHVKTAVTRRLAAYVRRFGAAVAGALRADGVVYTVEYSHAYYTCFPMQVLRSGHNNYERTSILVDCW